MIGAFHMGAPTDRYFRFDLLFKVTGVKV